VSRVRSALSKNICVLVCLFVLDLGVSMYYSVKEVPVKDRSCNTYKACVMDSR
jgi:hypothetical protein